MGNADDWLADEQIVIFRKGNGNIPDISCSGAPDQNPAGSEQI